jgi:tetratricopeptide (TPR) repeat protein
MGDVYLARDERLQRDVALKVLRATGSQESLERFIREARVASSLTHPNVVQIYDIGETDKVSYIAMEYIDGETLAHRITTRGRLDPAEVVRIGIGVCEALDEAHTRGIIHRDIKSANIMLTRKGVVKVLDFGLAKFGITNSDSTVATGLTTTGAVVGTVSYMSPEQVVGGSLDHRSDLFSLGVVLYQAATGNLPFEARSTFQILEKIVRAEPDPAEIEPAALKDIVRRCLEKDPIRRPQSAAEVLELLRPCLPSSKEHRTVVARPSSVGRKFGIAALVLVVILAGVLLRLPRPGGPGPNPTARQNLVILPVRLITDNVESRAFSDGLMETVTAKLIEFAGQQNIDIAATSEVQSRHVQKLEDARTELGATLVVEGTLQESGNSVRSNWTLTDVSNRRLVRADSFTLDKSDPFALQDRVVEGLARLLDLPLTTADLQALHERPTQTAGAYDLYLHGRGYLQNYDHPENLDNAIRVFQETLDRDPNYALAYAGIGEAYFRKYELTNNTQWMDPARQNCEHALAMDEMPAEPHTCLGLVENAAGRYEKAVLEFQHAITREPNDESAYIGLAGAYDHLNDKQNAEDAYRKAISVRPSHWATYSRLGAYYSSKSRYADAERMFQQVIALVPDSYRGYSNLGVTYFYEGKNAQAIDAFEKSMSLKPNYLAASNLGTLYSFSQDYTRAAKAFEQAIALNGSDYVVWGNLGTARSHINDSAGARAAFLRAIELAEAKHKLNPRDAKVVVDLAEYYAHSGEKNKSGPLLEQALALAPDSATVLFRAAIVYEAELGSRDEALKWLKKAAEKGYSWKEIDTASSLRNLRSDPRFKQLQQGSKNK